MSTATLSKTWYPAHVVDSGHPTDFLIVEGDPINGNVVGAYGSMGEAHYISRLHNKHQSLHSLPLSEIQAMYESEIDFEIIGQWDAGITWTLGSYGNPDLATLVEQGRAGTEETVEEAIIALVNAARRKLPDSLYAKRGPRVDLELQRDQRSEEDLAAELKAFGSFVLSFDADESVRPDGIPWTVEVGDGAWGGSTARDAMLFALDGLRA